MIFGIPSSCRAIVERSNVRKPLKDDFVTNCLGVHKDCRSLKVVQEVVQRSFGLEVSRAEENAFCVAFVVFVMATLLCPVAKHNYVSDGYWHALSNPASISEYDWSSYVLKKLFESATKMKRDMERGVRLMNLTGCFLFAQVLYLDSIDLGDLNTPHIDFPRIRNFTFDRMKCMISALNTSKDVDMRHIESFAIPKL